jgi:hypothetical protein
VAAGPLVAAAGVVYLLATVDETPDFLLGILPGMTILALGLALVVAPLTTAIVAEADEHDAGVASGVYNAVVRVAGLLATAGVGTIAGGALDLGGFRMALAVATGLLALGGAIGLGGIRNPQRDIPAIVVGPALGADSRATRAPTRAPHGRDARRRTRSYEGAPDQGVPPS